MGILRQVEVVVLEGCLGEERSVESSEVLILGRCGKSCDCDCGLVG